MAGKTKKETRSLHVVLLGSSLLWDLSLTTFVEVFFVFEPEPNSEGL